MRRAWNTCSASGSVRVMPAPGASVRQSGIRWRRRKPVPANGAGITSTRWPAASLKSAGPSGVDPGERGGVHGARDNNGGKLGLVGARGGQGGVHGGHDGVPIVAATMARVQDQKRSCTWKGRGLTVNPPCRRSGPGTAPGPETLQDAE